MTNTKIGQIKFIYIKEMDHSKDGRLHPFLAMAQDGETLKGFALSSKQCLEYKGTQKGFFAKDRIAYPAFNHGEFEIPMSQFSGPAIAELGKRERTEIKLEFARYQKAFG